MVSSLALFDRMSIVRAALLDSFYFSVWLVSVLCRTPPVIMSKLGIDSKTRFIIGIIVLFCIPIAMLLIPITVFCLIVDVFYRVRDFPLVRFVLRILDLDF